VQNCQLTIMSLIDLKKSITTLSLQYLYIY